MGNSNSNSNRNSNKIPESQLKLAASLTTIKSRLAQATRSPSNHKQVWNNFVKNA